MPENFFDAPDDNPPIWRFVDHSKFIWILQNSSLYFRRTDLMNDPYEGHPPISYLKNDLDRLRNRRENINDKLSPDSDEGPLPPAKPGDALMPFEHLRRCYFINCWHENEHESVAMWKLFLSSGDGVAIRTDFEAVYSAIKNSDELEINGGRMNYEDYEEYEFDSLNLFAAHSMKQHEYNYENEIRFSIFSPPSTESDELEAGDTVNYQYGDQEEGIPIKVNLEELIDEVRISPYSPGWVDKDYWEDLLNRYCVNIDVSESVVTVPPEDRLQ